MENSQNFSDSCILDKNIKKKVLKKGGGVYRVIIRISKFGPKQGGLPGGGVGMKVTVFLKKLSGGLCEGRR